MVTFPASTEGGRPQVPLHALFQGRVSPQVKPLQSVSFPHMKDSKVPGEI